MTSDQEVQFSVMTLVEVLRHEHRRKATGATLRDYLHRQLELGREPDHYRMEFLRNGVYGVMGTLKMLADQFNRDHQDDKISSADFLDVLTSTMKTIVGHTDSN